MSNRVDFVGYHGTSKESGDKILNESFLKSDTLDEWLGKGVYFFISGISDPKNDAECWAKKMAYDNDSHVLKYDKLKVLKSKISATDDQILDLDTNKGKIFFSTFRRKFYKKLETARKEMEKDCSDCFFIELIAKKNVTFKPLKIVKGMMPVKLTKSDGFKGTFTRVPNCTILAVRDNGCISETEESLEDTVK